MVASVGRITAGRGYDYLTRDVATSKHDYYTGRGEAPGVWAGRGSALLGLSGQVDPEDMAVLFGRFVVPSTVGGVRLPSGRWQPEQVLGRVVSTRVRADGTIAEPVAAFDVTFSPAKSVSLLWGLTTDPTVRRAVERAHEDAVAAGLDYLDRVAGHTRAGAGGVRKVAGEALIGAGHCDELAVAGDLVWVVEVVGDSGHPVRIAWQEHVLRYVTLCDPGCVLWSVAVYRGLVEGRHQFTASTRSR